MALELKHIYKSYGEDTIFLNFSLIFPDACTMAVVAPPKWGKTTLMNLIAGLEQPDYGKILGRKRISMLFQENRLLERASVYENLNFVCRAENLKLKMPALLGLFELEHLINKKAGYLNPCEQRRLAIVRALIPDFGLLLLDEPLKGIENKPNTAEFISRIAGNRQIIITTQNVEDARLFNAKVLQII